MKISNSKIQIENTGLSEEVYQYMQNIFNQYPAIEQVILYGSRAKGNFRHNSDIDLVINGPSLPFEDMLRISWQLDDLLLPYTMDLSLLHHIQDPDLLDHISRVGKCIYRS